MKKLLKFIKQIFKHNNHKRKNGNGNYDLENDTSTSLEEDVIIDNFSSFQDLKAGEVMIPRTEIVAISHNISLESLKRKFIETSFTRMPVYKENLDEIIGFIHVKDFIHYIDGSKDFQIDKIMRNLTYSPRSAKCTDLLSKMQKNASHLAIVLDEYGGTEGMVTIENLVEKILGDIKDEHEQEDKILIIQSGEDVYNIDARASVEDVEKCLEVSLSNEDGEYETFGGFVLSFLGRIPEKGEKIMHDSGIKIEILDADERKIKETKVIKL